MKQLIECVPNFSEGNDMSLIGKITDEIKAVEGVKLLDVDPGKATNRTVVTFVGEPEPVCEAAYRAVKKAGELIDMSKHHGEHPRFGATDVCPLVPVANISMEETVEYAHKLAKRIGEELEIPIYCYESAAYKPERKNLANCRSGEYEGLKDKLVNPEWKPDFGPAEFTHGVVKTGCTAVGARNFLVAYNVNLNTTSVRRANAIAFDVRERGRVKREGNTLTGKIVKDEKGNKVYTPGTLKSVKAIGWYIEEYGVAQISMNLTDISVCSVHQAFEEVCKKADARGIRVTGSELVGLVPLNSLLEAGRYFLKKQQRSTGISDAEIIKIAVKSLGLDDLAPFDPQKKVIEYLLEDNSGKRLIDMNLKAFAEETASESPAPGGGSISAYMGAMGAALGTMVANLSSHKRGWDDRWEEFSDWAVKGKYYQDLLVKMVDEDTNAFNKIMDAFALPKKTDEEKAARHEAIQAATKFAIEVPFKTMQLCYESMQVMKAMAEIGNPNSVSDAGVGALAARAGVRGAYLNVRINAASYEDKTFVDDILAKAADISAKAEAAENEIMNIVETKL
ncbi:MAG: glutamate formimidoyltransferase [Bacteroidales bacterium]|jgi:glutamate formiminotransferase / formiminotetrahydrofolate cyclodeaminase|nr:glutamate formimidoyltransferase [Bacteroidales bacterium]MDD2205231.1 glutamate formimidoyltransferase [Bacteroidales bacterium]MDD3151667.1 glutamate formimidoyltransferase [Bacteroidales bacterium]MDD3914682.1 glutamate formimidoyltransferase [Bacteroidales bacterium]MDD4633403.1 glutamate formimidoyltransferase [Bacteroidales bacterium]